MVVVVLQTIPRLGKVPPAANQRQHHLVYVYVSRQLGLIYTYLQYFLINFSEFILSDPRHVGNKVTTRHTTQKKRTRHYMMSPTRRPCRADVSGRHDTMSSKPTADDI